MSHSSPINRVPPQPRLRGAKLAYDNILWEVEAGVAVLTLNRPHKLNAFTADMLTEMRAAVEAAADAGIRALLVTGAGRAFSAGQDLDDRVAGDGGEPPDLSHTLETFYNPLVRALRRLPKPVVVAVNGVAAGAGANIALAGDVVVAARSATFIQAFSRIGLVPDSGGTWYLPRLIGRSRALGLALFADPLPAEAAAEMGLIWEVYEDEDLQGQARALAEQLAAGPTAGYAMLKKAIDASATNDLDAQLDLERDLQGAAGRTADYREGVAAFLEKRAPVYRGE